MRIFTGPQGSRAFIWDDDKLWAFGAKYDNVMGGRTTVSRPGGPYLVECWEGGPIEDIAFCFSMTIILGVDGTVWKSRGSILKKVEFPYAPASRIVQISAGYAHYMILEESGTVWSVANNTNANQYGAMGTEPDRPTPHFPYIVPNIPPMKRIACGGHFTITQDETGRFWQFGSNLKHKTVRKPTLLPEFDMSPGEIRSLNTGGSIAVILDSKGKLWTCQMGRMNAYFQCGRSGPLESFGRVPNLPEIVSVSNGDGFTLAKDISGDVWVWGTDYFGQFSLNDWTPPTTILSNIVKPQVSEDLSGCDSIHAGRSFLITNSIWNGLKVCGDNYQGNLGLDDKENRHTLTPHPMWPGRPIRQKSARSAHVE